MNTGLCELIYNDTLKQWETHNGVDLKVASGSKVYSILDGKVKDILNQIEKIEKDFL